MSQAMKKLIYLSSLLTVAVGLTGCNDDREFATAGEGAVVLSASYNSDVTIASRASLEDELSQSTIIWISSEKGLVRKFQGLDQLPAEGIKLVSGEYIAEAWAGDSLPASFEARYFKGREPFTITKGTTRVEIQCKIANVLASVEYADNVKELLSDYSLTIGHRRGQLTFEGDDSRHGYFMMPTGISDLEWTLTGVQVDGSSFEKKGVIPAVKPATHYKLNVVFNPDMEEIGGGYLDIVIDESEIEVDDQIVITAAPTISGYGFDINKPIFAEPGMVGKKSVYVTAATSLTHMIVEGDALEPIIGGRDVDLFDADSSVIEQLKEAGIDYQYVYDADADISNLKLSFWPSFTSTLTGDNEFRFAATDSKGKTGRATLVVSVSDASVNANELPVDALTTWPTKMRIYGTLLKEGVTNPGFEYRATGTSDWTYVAGEFEAGTSTEYFADLTGLEAGTEYEYRAVCDGFVSTRIYTASTQPAVQFPNAGFEIWSTSGKVVIPGSDMSFWDSGNHGSATMSKNITDKDATYKHGGEYSAKLKSQFVGIGTIGKFAAGNIFAGNYLYTDGTDGELGWGRPFTTRPSELKVWVRYEPGTVDSKGSGDYMPKGAKDRGVIYLALVDGTLQQYNQSKSDYNGSKWPCVVKTKSSNRQLFDANGSNVIAYAEIALDDATEGTGMVEKTVTINYLRTDVNPSYVIFVASASRFGDYFQGGEGSTLWIDDVELVY